MTEREWKDGLTERCDAIKNAYAELYNHIDEGEKNQENFEADEDELLAFITIKLKRLLSEIEKLAELK